MNELNHNTPANISRHPPARRWMLAVSLAFVVGAMTTAGASLAGGGNDRFAHHAHGRHVAMDPAAMDRHLDKMADQLLADGTPEQKVRVAAIAKSAIADLRPAHAQLHKAHTRAHELLMAPVVDRAALEQLRAEQLAQMDFASKRILTALEDAAEVLTPAQREKLAEHIRRRMH
jgi:protein CpxP